jgi:hypothetical protein
MCRKLIYLIPFVFVMVFAFVGTAQAALLLNSSFESWTGGPSYTSVPPLWFTHWELYPGLVPPVTGIWAWGTGNCDVNTTYKHSGNASIRFYGTNGGAGIYQGVLMSPGTSCTISAYAKDVGGAGAGNSGIDLIFFSGIPSEAVQDPPHILRVDKYVSDFNQPDAQGWRYGSLTVVAPAGTVFMKFEINSNVNSAAYDFLFDDVVGLPLPVTASNPYPDDKSAYDGINVTLTWDAGRYAATTNGHHVYFGSVLSDVNQGINNTDKDLRTPPNYPVTTSLTPGTTYYWRIDEVNNNPGAPAGSPWKGSVWRFTVKPLTAYNPSPPDGDILVDPNANLSWSKGMRAVTHKVYFDDVKANVTTRHGCDVNGFSRPDPNYIIGPPLTLGKTYYWAIDEVNVITWPGPVWSFTTWPDTPITDPNLAGWWKFDLDENSGGSKTFDSSGHNRHGTLHGSPAYATGIFDDAISLDGIDDWVRVGSVGISGRAPRTIAGWVKVNDTNIPAGGTIFGFAGNEGYRLFNISLSAAPAGTNYYTLNIYQQTWNIVPIDTEWHYFAATYTPDGNTIKLYNNGSEVNSIAYGLNTIDEVRMGESAVNANNYFPGIIDDVRIYNKVLTEAEIGRIMGSTSAYNPHPGDGATGVPRALTLLTWAPGLDANSVTKGKGHRVYFDLNEDNVINRSGCVVNGVSRTEPNYTLPTPPAPLNFDQTYYWRVDEVNKAGLDPCFWPGDVWKFTTSNYAVVENFNSYAGDGPLRGVWTATSSTGAVVSLQKGSDDATLVRDGNSMMYQYDNYNWFYSEAYANIADLPSKIGSNWKVGGVKALSLWFYGQAGNDANEQMYVALTGGGKTGVVTYGDNPDEDPNYVKDPKWHEWNIDLQDFVDDNSVDLANVSRITIGFGDGIDPGYSWGNSTVYFDNIRLYIPRCMPGTVPDSASGNCLIDYPDLLILRNNWLISDYNVIPVNPGDPNVDTTLIGWWRLDEGAGTTTTDSSINNNNGNLRGDPNSHPQWVAGYIGSGALDFNGVTDYVDCSNNVSLNEPNITGKITLAAWVDTNDCGNSQFNPYIAKGDHAYALQHRSANELEIAIYGAGTTWYLASTPVNSSFNGVWHHLAGTYNGSQIKLYVDGELNATTDYVGSIPSTPYNVNIGRSSEVITRFYDGLLDDVRIYSRALSQEEVAYLAGKTAKFTQPLYLLLTPKNPGINLFDDGKINFKDYAVLADEWLEEVLWPAVP